MVSVGVSGRFCWRFLGGLWWRIQGGFWVIYGGIGWVFGLLWGSKFMHLRIEGGAFLGRSIVDGSGFVSGSKVVNR